MKLQGALVVVVLFGAGMLEAQAIPAVGDRVRVTAAGSRFEGKLMTWTADSVVVGEGLHSAVLSRGTVTALDREVGRTSAFLHHMSIGALSGGLLGAVLGAVLGGGHCFGCPDAGTTIGAGAIFFGGAGAVIGGLAGAASTMSVWEPVPLKAGQVALRLSPVLAPAGLGLRGTVWFR